MSILDDIRTKSSTKDNIKSKDIQKTPNITKEKIQECKSISDKFELGKQDRRDRKNDSIVAEKAKEKLFGSKDTKIKKTQNQANIDKEENVRKLDYDSKANKFAKELLEKVKLVEPKITSDMKSLERNGAKLEGLDYRLKGEESLTRKIAADALLEDKTLEEAKNGIGDCVRYTLVAEENNYSSMVESSLKEVYEKGYSIDNLKNSWGNPIYQGINTNITSPEGIKMELQFHTKDSYNTKEVLNHKHYEIARDLNATEEEKNEANIIMRENQSKVNVPKGAKELKWNEENK